MYSSCTTQLPYITLEYVFVEWDEEGDHSVIEGKAVTLVDAGVGFVRGAKVECVLREGKYSATVLSAGWVTSLCLSYV